jgi:hypothetical protein
MDKYKITIHMNTVLSSKIKDWLDQSQDNVWLDQSQDNVWLDQSQDNASTLIVTIFCKTSSEIYNIVKITKLTSVMCYDI